MSDERILKRLLAKVNFTPTCWLWTDYTDRKGYARIRVGKRMLRAHRPMYEICVRPIPIGLQIDHLCRVRHCINPDHLEVVTSRINTLRGDTFAAREARQTHCLRGHPLSGANLQRFGDGKRRCAICTRKRKLAYYYKKVGKIE